MVWKYGSSITGSVHGGLIEEILSSVMFNGAATTVSGNAVDLFCDFKSLRTGGANIAGCGEDAMRKRVDRYE